MYTGPLLAVARTDSKMIHSLLKPHYSIWSLPSVTRDGPLFTLSFQKVRFAIQKTLPIWTICQIKICGKVWSCFALYKNQFLNLDLHPLKVCFVIFFLVLRNPGYYLCVAVSPWPTLIRSIHTWTFSHLQLTRNIEIHIHQYLICGILLLVR